MWEGWNYWGTLISKATGKSDQANANYKERKEEKKKEENWKAYIPVKSFKIKLL